jgi:hypothetical protein
MLPRIFIVIISTLFTQTSFCQQDSLIEYKGGFNLLGRDILRHLPINPAVTTYHDEGVDYDRYYTVVLKILKNGGIGKSIFVFSVMDSLKVPLVVDAIRFTAGKWINHSGEDQTVVLPIYLVNRMDEPSDSTKKIPIISQQYYLDGSRSKVVYLAPVILTSYPPKR